MKNLFVKRWFVGKDVASALGYAKERNALDRHVNSEDKTTALIQGGCSNTRDALNCHIDKEDKNTVVIPDGNKGINQTIITESRLYALVFGSRLETAKQ